MTEHHPIHTLKANLEAARLKAVERLAASDAALFPHTLGELAVIQAALTAVREEIAAHATQVAWASPKELE